MDIYQFINKDNIDHTPINSSIIKKPINNVNNDESNDESNDNNNILPIRKENLDILSVLTLDEIQVDINDIIYKISNKLNYYIDEDNIKKKINLQLIKIIKKNIIQNKNLCIACNVDIGINNPRQLCGKTKCIYIN